MATPPFSGFLLIVTEGEDAIEAEAWAYDARICKTLAEVATQIAAGNLNAAVGHTIPPSPAGLRENLKVSNPDRYWDRQAATKTIAKSYLSGLIDLVCTKSAT